MERLDKKNGILLHFFVAICGLISFVSITIFLIWVFAFKEHALSIVADKPAFIRDFSNPFDYIFPMGVLMGIFFPYYYVLFKSRKIIIDRKNKTLCVGEKFYPIDKARISDEYIYFGLNFSFLTIMNNGDVRKYIFISRRGVDKIPFGIHRRESHEI